MEGYDISVHDLTAWVNLIGPDIRQLLVTLEYLHYEQRSRPLLLGGQQSRMSRSHNSSDTLLRSHIDLLMGQAKSHTTQQQQQSWLHVSDHIPGAQMTPLCMQLVENDSAIPRSTSGDDDDRLLEQLTAWMDNRSIIDYGVGMTGKQISQVCGKEYDVIPIVLFVVSFYRSTVWMNTALMMIKQADTCIVGKNRMIGITMICRLVWN